MILDETLFDDIVDIEVPSIETDSIDIDDIELSGPEVGEDFGIASLLLSAISNCAENINSYNSIRANIRENSDLIPIIDDIVGNENLTMGKLQSMLKTVSPNAEMIMNGAVEVEDKINTNEEFDDDFSEFENFNLSKNIEDINQFSNNVFKESKSTFQPLKVTTSEYNMSSNKEATSTSSIIENIANEIVDIVDVDDEF